MRLGFFALPGRILVPRGNEGWMDGWKGREEGKKEARKAKERRKERGKTRWMAFFGFTDARDMSEQNKNTPPVICNLKI